MIRIARRISECVNRISNIFNSYRALDLSVGLCLLSLAMVFILQPDEKFIAPSYRYFRSFNVDLQQWVVLFLGILLSLPMIKPGEFMISVRKSKFVFLIAKEFCDTFELFQDLGRCSAGLYYLFYTCSLGKAAIEDGNPGLIASFIPIGFVLLLSTIGKVYERR